MGVTKEVTFGSAKNEVFPLVREQFINERYQVVEILRIGYCPKQTATKEGVGHFPCVREL